MKANIRLKYIHKILMLIFKPEVSTLKNKTVLSFLVIGV